MSLFIFCSPDWDGQICKDRDRHKVYDQLDQRLQNPEAVAYPEAWKRRRKAEDNFDFDP